MLFFVVFFVNIHDTARDLKRGICCIGFRMFDPEVARRRDNEEVMCGTPEKKPRKYNSLLKNVQVEALPLALGKIPIHTN